MPRGGNSAGGAPVRGGAMVLYRGGALAGGSQQKSRETVRVGNYTYRKRRLSTVEAFNKARVKTVHQEEALLKRVRALKRENIKLKGKENAAKRAANKAEIGRLERRMKNSQARFNRIQARQRTLSNKGATFEFSMAKSGKQIFGMDLHREYSANRVLGLKPGASLSEAASAYRRLATKYHPDSPRNHNLTPREQSRNQRRFQLATEAYNAYRDHSRTGRM